MKTLPNIGKRNTFHLYIMCQAREILSFSYVWMGVTLFWQGVSGCGWVRPFFAWVWVGVGECDLFGWVWVEVGECDIFWLIQVIVGECDLFMDRCGWVQVSVTFFWLVVDGCG